MFDTHTRKLLEMVMHDYADWLCVRGYIEPVVPDSLETVREFLDEIEDFYKDRV